MSQKILIMAGGTGGHVYPALAVASALRKQGFEVAWLGNPRGFEYAKVTTAGFQFLPIEVRGLRGRGLKDTLTAPLMLTKALWQTWRHFRAFRPDKVVGFGGFVSGPGGLVAKLRGVPLYIHEQNAIFGLTNRVLARCAKTVMLGYPLPKLALPNAVVTGNPVRAEIAAVPAPAKRFAGRSGRLKMLVLGGSQGAKALNEVLPQALALLDEATRPEVIHQVGASAQVLHQVQNAYQAANIKADVRPFIDDMAQVYGAVDFIVARSGALTVAEVATVGLGAIFVPYPAAVDDHQTANAQTLAEIGAAEVLPQSALTAERLAQTLRTYHERAVCVQRAEAARSRSQAEALAKIVAIIQS